MPLDGGNYTNAPPVPLLLVHGDQDSTVPIAASQQAFAELHGFRWFVTMRGAGHVNIFAPPWGQVLLDGVIAFLNYQLKGDHRLEMGFPQQVKHSGRGRPPARQLTGPGARPMSRPSPVPSRPGSPRRRPPRDRHDSAQAGSHPGVAGAPTAMALLALLAVIAAGACSSSGSTGSASHPWSASGSRCPDAEVTTYTAPRLALHRCGVSALVLNFWARSCAPCAEEMPTLEASYRAAPAGRVRFLGVDASEPESVGQPFARRLGVTYPLAGDPEGTLVARLGVSSLPTTVFVDAQGTVRGVHVGRLSAATLATGLQAVGLP